MGSGQLSMYCIVLYIPHTKGGKNILLPLCNSSSFQSNLTGLILTWLYVSTKKHRKNRELAVKGKPDDR